jgi:hypothetical protein
MEDAATATTPPPASAPPPTTGTGRYSHKFRTRGDRATDTLGTARVRNL